MKARRQLLLERRIRGTTRQPNAREFEYDDWFAFNGLDVYPASIPDSSLGVQAFAIDRLFMSRVDVINDYSRVY